MDRHHFHEARALVEHAFEQWLPRRCTPGWLDTVTGPARFGWDVEAIQRGFIEPMYEIHGARPEVWRPVLTVNLVAAGGEEPSRYLPVLLATELQYLASLMLEPFRNGRSIAEAAPADAQVPMPVMVTVAYTARQMASTLVIRHAEALEPTARAWLTYRVSRALYQTSAGAAVDIFSGSRGMGGAKPWHLELLAGPLTFSLSVDCALAALGLMHAPEAPLLREAAGRAGTTYRLAVELLAVRDRARGQTPRVPLEPALHGSPLAAHPGEAPAATWRRALETGAARAILAAARQEREAAAVALAFAPGPLSSALQAFLEAVVDAHLAGAEEAGHAK